MEKVQFLRNQPLNGSIHYESGNQSLISALDSVYGNDEVVLGNVGLARQRSLGNKSVWGAWFYGCPQVQTRIDGEGIILFDDRVVDVNNLGNHPLLNPSFLKDNWSKLENGALPVRREYVSSLLDLSHIPHSGVRAVYHKDLGRINTSFLVSEAKVHPYFTAFTGLSEAERAAYLNEHAQRYNALNLWCALDDAERGQAMGRLSVFNNNNNLNGNNNLNNDNAQLFGITSAWLRKI